MGIVSQAAKRKLRGIGAARKRTAGTRLAKPERARKITSAIEDYLRDMGLSEQEKSERVSLFSERVNRVIARRAKS